MPIIDETVAVVRDSEWQYVRIPLTVDLPAGDLHLHRDTADGPITLSKLQKERHEQNFSKFFRLLDEAHAAGETLEVERNFCAARDVEI